MTVAGLGWRLGLAGLLMAVGLAFVGSVMGSLLMVGYPDGPVFWRESVVRYVRESLGGEARNPNIVKVGRFQVRFLQVRHEDFSLPGKEPRRRGFRGDLRATGFKSLRASRMGDLLRSHGVTDGVDWSK